ncbi:MAG TPA: methyltransferase domain-containing protein [Gammaproteobacteria bacterium]|nr:methyltransferase domain-containing protein [Gammaproteobacteria bacterium]
MTPGTASPIERYYRLQAPIYDLTRWSFLFGRRALVRHAARLSEPATVLEVGCGTGSNLRQLARSFPAAQLVGVDASADMLAQARRRTRTCRDRVRLERCPYDRARSGGAFDLIVFSYALSMFNPGWEAALDGAWHDLAPDGLIAVVDFHASPIPAFKRWMGCNHVRMDGHLLPALTERFSVLRADTDASYGGLWSRFTFLGTKPVYCLT